MIEFFQNIFSFSQESPLTFTGKEFWVFYLVVFFGFSLIRKRLNLRSAFLFIVSLFFYYKTSGFFFFILIFSTLVDFFIGKSIEKSTKELNRKLWLTLSVISNLGILFYFKYAYFFADFINDMAGTNFEVVNYLAQWSNQFTGTAFRIDNILLPFRMLAKYVLSVQKGQRKLDHIFIPKYAELKEYWNESTTSDHLALIAEIAIKID